MWVLLNPLTSLAAIMVAYWYLNQWSFVVKTTVIFIGILLYIALRPRPKRNSSLWRTLGGKSPVDGRVQRELSLAVRNNVVLATRTSPLIVFSYEIKADDDVSSPLTPNTTSHHKISSSTTSLLRLVHRLSQHDAGAFLNHAFAFATPEFDAVPALYVGDPNVMDHRGRLSGKGTSVTWWFGPSQLADALPLVRVTLHMLGGIMQYSRPLLLQLLQRKARAAVILQRPIQCHSANLKQKGVFAAAIKSGAIIVPVIVDRRKRGEVILGTPLTVAKEEIPTAVAVRALAVDFGEELKRCYSQLAQESLVLVDL